MLHHTTNQRVRRRKHLHCLRDHQRPKVILDAAEPQPALGTRHVEEGAACAHRQTLDGNPQLHQHLILEAIQIKTQPNLLNREDGLLPDGLFKAAGPLNRNVLSTETLAIFWPPVFFSTCLFFSRLCFSLVPVLYCAVLCCYVIPLMMRAV